ncbi:MAG: hypothetical protein HXX10_03860 [Rhodoplanes sp.]|uniref:hypothetical protein n=1 Tax=Rhodoplanes sp. TaxID=1968906 RepID=UPI0017DB9753|nr:hypothetical protein [Rhodoplanes sp.]NVO13149.1 hypothetical protein [Rhodoplanes sp.]
MSRRSSALVFAVLWTGAMPWTALPGDIGPAAALIVLIALIILGVLAGLICYRLSGPTWVDADTRSSRTGEAQRPSGSPGCGLSKLTHS